MAFNWKPLSSFFKPTVTEENKEKKEEKKEGNDQGGDQGDDDEDAGDNQGDDQGETEEETGDDQGKSAKKSGKEATISITQKEYKSFIAAQAELEKFGKNSQDRNNFLKDATQLQVWYQAAIGAGATSNGDANAQEKNTKKESKVTKEAKAAYQKSAASQGK